MNDFDFSSAIDEEAKRQAPPLGAPMPATPQIPDPFAAGIEAEAQRQAALRQSIIPAIQIDPQRAARLNAMSKTTGLPVDLIERQEQSVEQLLILDKMDALASQHPKLGQALTNPAFARVAHGEAEQLGFLERQAEAAKSGWSSGMASRKTTELVVALDNLKRLQEVERKLAAGEYLTPMDRAFAAMTPDVRAETIAGLERKATALRLESAAFSKESQDAARKMNPAVQQALNAKSMGEFWEGFKVAPLELLAALPIQSMTQNPVAAVSMAVPIVGAVSRTAGAAMALAGAAGVATAGAATEYGAAVLEALGDAGVDTTDPKAILAAVQDDKLMEDVRQAALVKSSVITAFDMASMGVAAKVFNPGRVTGTNIASKVAKEAGNVVVQAGIQGAMGGAGEVLGSVASGGEVQAGAVMAEILGGGAGAIGNVALMSGVRAREELAAATRSTETLKALMTSVEAIKLRTADPEQFRQFAESIVSEGADTVYVDGGVLSQAANTSPEMAAIIAGIPALQAQMDEARLGTDVLIPTADLLTYIAGTPLAEALLPHLRTNVSALSVTDAQERLAAAAKAIEGAQEQDAQREAFQASQKAVADSILADIVATGTVPRDQARVQAALAANMFAVLAGKLATTPEAVYSEMYPLNIQGERPTATQQWNELVADLNDAMGRADETQARRARLKLEAIRPQMEQERAARAAVRQPTDTIPTLDAEGRPLQAVPDVPRETAPLAAGTFEAVPEAAAEGAALSQSDRAGMPGDIDLPEADVVAEAGDDVAAGTDAVQAGDDNVFDQMATQAGLGKALGLSKSRIWQKGRDLKVAMQEALQSLAERLGFDPATPSPRSTEYLVRVAVADGLAALEQNPNAVGWYDLKTRQALAIMSLVHPELATDPNAKLAFVWAMAVTSNGLKVGKNFEIAEQVYRRFRADGRMPPDAGIGTAGEAINKSLVLFDTLREAWGIEALRKFMLTDFTVAEITAIDPELKPGGEHADVTVKGAAILGPKIGNGFFSNLYGNFGSLTMDRWLIRTWGRWTGTLIKAQPQLTDAARTRLRAVLTGMDPAEAKRLSGLVGIEITAGVDPDALAVAIQEASMDPDARSAMNETAAGLEFRKAGNGLAKYLDGQKEAPGGPVERKYIREVFGRALEELRADSRYSGLTMADLQAVLWYAEKRLYETAKQDLTDEDAVDGYADEEAPDYANAAAAVARAAGISDRRIANALKKEQESGRAADARPGDGEVPGAGTGQQGPAGSFTRQEKRFFLGARAVIRARSNRDGDARASWSYARKSGADGEGLRLLRALGVRWTTEWSGGKRLKALFKANELEAPNFVELASTPENAQRFADLIGDSKRASGPFGAAVYVYPASEYQQMRLFLARDGLTGVAVKPDGDIVSVFSSNGGGRAAMELAVAAGGRKLDAFDTILPRFYAPHGFVAVSRLAWDDSQAPDGWDKKAFAEFNGGEPDVVFMVYDPARATGIYSIKDGRRAAAYDIAVGAQTRAVRQAARPPSGVLSQAGNNDPATLSQDTGPGRPDRGQITFGQGVGVSGGTMRLLAGADFSSFLHEMGHFYLEVLADIAGKTNAPETVSQDFQILMDWFGVTPEQWQGMTLEQKREHHEKFARGAEAYFFEGRAPTKELRGVFSRVRSWMMGVYRSLVDLGVPLTDEVRGVFDRMLASNNQLQEAAEGRAYTPIFKSAAEAGMTEAEYQAYMDSGMDQTRTALEELHGRSLADMQWLSKARGVTLRRLQREAKEKRDAVEAEVRLEILAEPLQLAIRFIKTGEVAEETMGRAALAGLDLLAGGASRLSTTALREIYGEGPAAVWRYLPTNMKQTDGGAHPDTVATVFGFSSGDEMVRAIVADGPIDERVQAETDARMLERYGDLATPEAMEAAVDQALQNTAHIRFLATEIATMQDMLAGREQTGTTTVRRGANRGQQRAVTVNAVVEAAKRWAEQIVGRTRIRDLSPRKYTVAANRAAKKAEALWAAGNRIQAADAKRDQILNARTARESAKARDEAERIVAHLRTLANRPSDKIAVEYRLQILAMLERFEFRAMSRKAADRATSLAAYLTKMAEAGVEPVISDKLRDEAFRTNYLNLTVAELRELDEAVKSLEATGRRLSKLRTAKGDREAQAAIDEAIESIRENGGDVRARQYEPTGRVTRLFRGFLAEHRKFASILRQLDGNKDNGILWQLLGRTVNEAADREAVMREQSTEALVKILSPVMGLGLGQKVHIPSINASLTRAGRLAVALNHGNEGNRQRVRDGHGWTEGQVADILATLSREEWTAVQAVWDHIDSYWPAIVEKTKRLNGLPPEKVEADAFTITFPDGSTLALRGGYYPAKASTELSSRAAGHDLAEQASNMMQGAYTASTTRRGHLKERAEESKQPIELSLDPLFTHVNNVTHDLAFHEWLIDANRILRDSKIDRAIRDHYPAETLSIIKEAIKDIAVGDTATMTNTEKMLMRFRGNVSAAVMGWSLTTSLLQPFGLAQSIVRIGPKWVFKGLGDALMSTARLENAMTAIREESSFMRLRAKTFNRELNEIHGRIRAGRSTNLGGRILTGYENSLFVLMQKMQLIADVPTWLGAKEKALAEGADAETAVALADQAVIDSQGSGMIKDLSGIQRGGTGLKILTMFYSYFNTTYNLTAESVSKRGRQLSEGQYLSAAAGFAADMTLLYVIPALAPALLIAMMRGEEIEDDEWAKWLAKKQISFALGTMVGVREFSGLMEGYPYAGPPALRIVSDVGKVGVQVAQGKVDEALVRSVVNLTGDAFGIPVTQIQRTVRGWLAWEEGDAPPTSILFGPPPRN